MRHAASQTVNCSVPQSVRSAIRTKLLRWYDHHKRDLPWRRRADDPYAQWVAEVMLQQTRVETVINYYEQFLRRYPTIRRLADADHEEVLKHWEGLGYYRRILHLHRAARMVCDDGGFIPDNAVALRTLPGIGEYTAAAIASIAFHRPEAAVDGNVARVLSRLFGVTEDVRSPVGKSRIGELARSLLPSRRFGDFNQAWMDLGSMVCTPKAPRCDACPLRAHCLAAESDNAEFYPVREAARSRKPKVVTLVVAVFVHEGKMLVRRRPRGGLWSGLWEFPNLELPAVARLASQRRQRAPHQSLDRQGADRSAFSEIERRYVLRLVRDMRILVSKRPKRVAEVRHQLTHRSLCFQVYVIEVKPANGKMTADTRWVSERSFQKLPVSTAHRRVFSSVPSGNTC